MTRPSIVDIIAAHAWTAILLQVNSKDPISRNGTHWRTTKANEIRAHRGNVGICGGTHAVLDVDRLDLFAEMEQALGPLTYTVRTGSNKPHFYVRAVPNLPRKYLWRGEKVGEIVRLSSEYVVAPPSIHPDTKRPYEWLADPFAPLPTLPDTWLRHIGTEARYASVVGSVDEKLIERALQQPGATRRRYGIKFQCPACAAAGYDEPKDNAVLKFDGQFGCAYDRGHQFAIAQQLGITIHRGVPLVEGFNRRLLRAMGFSL